MIVVITGATSGIGEATALYLENKGYTIYSVARTIKDEPNINYVQADLTKPNQVAAAIDHIIKVAGRIDVLINNAGMGTSGAMEYQPSSAIDKIIDVNIKGMITITNLVIPYLRESQGRIINIGSIAGELPIPFQTMYSLTKSAVHSYSLALANELKPFKIKVTCVMPGDTKTNFTKNREKIDTNQLYNERIERSVSRMEKDEANGCSPVIISRVIYRSLKKKNPPLKIAVGFTYKLFLFLNRILPTRFVNYILYQMYSK